MEQENPLNSENELSIEKKIDFSIKMRDAALGCEGRRQIFEWKFCILIWTAIGGLIGVLLVNKVALNRDVLNVEQLLLFGRVIFIIVVAFQICCCMATHVDKRRAEMYEDIINDALGITKKNKKKFNKAVKHIKWAKGLWAPLSQIAVTGTLLLALWYVYLALPSEAEKSDDTGKQDITTEIRQCVCEPPQKKCKLQQNKRNRRHMKRETSRSKR